MRLQPNSSPKIQFGPFEFEHRSGDLRKFGNRIRLQGKPLQILEILIGQPGEVISRDELQRHLWQGNTFVDFEQGLNTAVNKLRQALGDSADQPRYIETVPGKGYRFIAPLQRPAVRQVLEIAPPSPRTEPEPRRRPRRWIPLAVGVAVAVLAGVTWLAVRRPEATSVAKSARFAVLPPAGFALEAGLGRQSFALSPDGAHLAFTAMDASGAFSAFIRDFNTLEPRLLPGSAGVHTLFWAPDSRSLFLSVNGKLQRAPLEGEARAVLGDAPGFLFSGAWLSPERMLLSSSSLSYSIPPSGGTAEPLKDLYQWPQMLPDGEHILYLVRDPQTHRHRARVARFGDHGSARDLIEPDSRVQYTASVAKPGTGYLMYLRAGNLLAQPFDPRALRVTSEAMPVVNRIHSFRPTGAADFSVASSGTLAYQSFASRSQLIWVDRQGRQVGSAGPANINVKSGRISPDGRKVAAAVYDVERGGQNL